jgi:hypothetical protein
MYIPGAVQDAIRQHVHEAVERTSEAYLAAA